MFANNNYPIILICLANENDIPSDLSRLFLDIFHIKSPNQTERFELLKWIININNIKCDLNLNDVANKTHGFLYEDLKALVYYAQRSLLRRLVKNNIKAVVNLKDFEIAIGRINVKYIFDLH